MNKINTDTLFLSLLFLAAGIVLTFCRGFISSLFYISGAILIIYNIFVIAAGILKGQSAIYIPKGLIGVAVGVVMIIMPKFISIGVPILIGLFFLLTGINSFFNVFITKHEQKIFAMSDIISAILLVLCGLFFISHPIKVSAVFSIIVGIIFMIGGISILAILFLRSRKPDEDDVIQIEDYTVKDDNKSDK